MIKGIWNNVEGRPGMIQSLPFRFLDKKATLKCNLVDIFGVGVERAYVIETDSLIPEADKNI